VSSPFPLVNCCNIAITLIEPPKPGGFECNGLISSLSVAS
jgi:hypothetical protein